MANVQNICNLIGREEYNICHILFLATILYSLRKNNNIGIPWKKKNRNLLISNKLMINY